MAETTEEYKNRINQIANSVGNELYLKDMRDNIAEGISKTGNRQADIEGQFQELIDNTTGKDVISAPELIAARNGKSNLKTRIDDLENETNAQLAQTNQEALRKRELEDLSPEVLSAIEGGAGTSFELLSIPQNGSVSYQKTDFIRPKKNLVDKDKVKRGVLLSTNPYGKEVPEPNYLTTEFTPVKGQTVTLSNPRVVFYYDENGDVIPESRIDNPNSKLTVSPPTEVSYLRASYSKTYENNFQIELGEEATEYEDYALEVPNLFIGDSKNNVLEGLEIDSFGDSIMKGAGNNNVGLRDLIAQKYGMIGSNYSVSGASIAYYSDRSHIVAQIQTAISAGITPDFLLLNGGINDVTFKNLGEISSDYNYESKGYATFSSGLEYCFGLLKTTFPDVPLIYIWVHNMPSRINVDQKAHHDRAVEICKKWSVPIVDMYENGGMNTHIPVHLQQFTHYPTENSGTHPNVSGYEKFYVPAVVSELKRVAQ